MKCKGNFIFKELKRIEAGVFKNDKGEEIPYNASYKLKVDEISETGINERIFKFSPDNTNILNSLSNAKPYENISIEFDVRFYSNGCRAIPVTISLVK